MFIQTAVVGIFASIKRYNQVMAIVRFGENKTLSRAEDLLDLDPGGKGHGFCQEGADKPATQEGLGPPLGRAEILHSRTMFWLQRFGLTTDFS